MRTSASVEQTEGEKAAKGKDVLGNTPRIIYTYEEKGQRLHVNADVGIRIGMDSHFTDIQMLGAGEQEDQQEESHPYIIFINS